MLNIMNNNYIKELLYFNYIFKFRYLFIISIFINSIILLYGFNFRDITSLIFIEGDWNSFWFSIFNKNQILYYGDYIYAPYNIGYLIKFMEVKYSFGLVFSIILFSITLSTIYYLLQSILLIIIPKHSFYLLLFFFLSPSAAFTNFVLYKEIFFTLAFICIFYICISILYKKKINYFLVFLIFLLAITIIDLSRPYTIHIVSFINFFLFVYLLSKIIFKNSDFGKFIFISFILSISTISSLNHFFNEIKLVNTVDNAVREYTIPLNFKPLNFLTLLDNYYEQNNISFKNERNHQKAHLLTSFKEQQKLLNNKELVTDESKIEHIEETLGVNIISDYVTVFSKQKNENYLMNNLVDSILSIFQPSIYYLSNSDVNIFFKLAFLFEILIFYLIFTFFLLSIVKNKNFNQSLKNYYLLLILVIIIAIINYLNQDIGSFIRHRFIFWKLTSILMIVESLKLFRKTN